MRNFYNQKEDIVSEALDGVVAGSGGKLVRFDPASHARVVLRADWDKSQVAVISGGGSGHEPTHTGFVGKGLLTAAVCGEVFASPSVDAVLATIVAVTGSKGCLLVVKNYTGDRLNFGLAAERAKAMGLQVEMVVVGDDISLPGSPQPRGLAGTIFVHKIAGFMAEEGRSLEEILSAADEANKGIFTIGVARDTCTLPGMEKHQRIPEGKIEIGLGIHGEPGVELTDLPWSLALAEELASRLSAHLSEGAQYALLFNNLGGLSGLECSVLFGDVMRTSLAKRLKYAAGPASLMTALDMPGFSLSVLELTPERERALSARTECAAMPWFLPVLPVTSVAVSRLAADVEFVPSDDYRVRQLVEAVVQTCLDMEADINALDAKVGDGDTGSTFAAAARAVDRVIDTLPFADGAALLSALSDIKRKSMGGSSGVLFAILMARAAEAYSEKPDWPLALLEGLEAMQKYGGAQLGDRTMIDALRPALEQLVKGGKFAAAAQCARAGADTTANMTRAGAGRSSYLDSRSLQGVADPGAEAVARIFEHIVKSRQLKTAV